MLNTVVARTVERVTTQTDILTDAFCAKEEELFPTTCLILWNALRCVKGGGEGRNKPTN